MTEDSTLIIEIDASIRSRLELIAQETGRSTSALAGEALSEYVTTQEWQIARIREAMAGMERGEGIPHEEVKRWVASWDTSNEVPMPTRK
ncbi:MAG: CopG family ribbon-helix-helix protein [Rhizobiales bacterium]|nr:CopG family ribbon-helix-helix protein [Hyphomicrobiales bacterium]